MILSIDLDKLGFCLAAIEILNEQSKKLLIIIAVVMITANSVHDLLMMIIKFLYIYYKFQSTFVYQLLRITLFIIGSKNNQVNNMGYIQLHDGSVQGKDLLKFLFPLVVFVKRFFKVIMSSCYNYNEKRNYSVFAVSQLSLKVLFCEYRYFR